MSKSAERAWIWKHWTVTKTIGVGPDMETDSLITFNDLEGEDLNAIERERSEWYVERLIVWGFAVFIAQGESTAGGSFCCIRVGQIDEAIDFGGSVSPSFQANDWVRIYQERWLLAHAPGGLPYIGAELAVTESGVPTAFVFPVPSRQFEMDLTFRSRVFEGSSIVIGLGTSPAFSGAGDQVRISGTFKALLRRGR